MIKLIRPTIPYLIELDDEDVLYIYNSLLEYKHFIKFQTIDKGVKRIRLAQLRDITNFFDPLV